MAVEDIRNMMHSTEEAVSDFFEEGDFDSLQIDNERQEMNEEMYEMITEIYQFLKNIKKA